MGRQAATRAPVGAKKYFLLILKVVGSGNGALLSVLVLVKYDILARYTGHIYDIRA